MLTVALKETDRNSNLSGRANDEAQRSISAPSIRVIQAGPGEDWFDEENVGCHSS